jgi:hypothetical protein
MFASFNMMYHKGINYTKKFIYPIDIHCHSILVYANNVVRLQLKFRKLSNIQPYMQWHRSFRHVRDSCESSTNGELILENRRVTICSSLAVCPCMALGFRFYSNKEVEMAVRELLQMQKKQVSTATKLDKFVPTWDKCKRVF